MYCRLITKALAGVAQIEPTSHPTSHPMHHAPTCRGQALDSQQLLHAAYVTRKRQRVAHHDDGLRARRCQNGAVTACDVHKEAGQKVAQPGSLHSAAWREIARMDGICSSKLAQCMVYKSEWCECMTE